VRNKNQLTLTRLKNVLRLKLLGEITLKDIIMQRVYIWTLCLIIGVIFSGCTLTSWGIKFEFVFINQTDYTIEFMINSDKEDGVWLSDDNRWSRMLEIPPNSISKVLANVGDGPKRIDPILNAREAIRHLLFNLEHKSGTVFIDKTECVFFDNSSFALASNYEYEVFGDRHIRYTYTFTNADFEVAKPCEEEE